MTTAKVIRSDEKTVTLGFEDGICRVVDREDIGFLVSDNSLVDVYHYVEDDSYMYSPHSGSSFSKNNNSSVSNQLKTIAGEKKRVKKLTYLLLAIFTGGIGGHKFYSGRIILGFIYLLFCWTYIPAVVSLVESIIAACKNSDEDGMIEI